MTARGEVAERVPAGRGGGPTRAPEDTAHAHRHPGDRSGVLAAGAADVARLRVLPTSRRAESVRGLQGALGNRALTRMVTSSPQPELPMSEPGDAVERQADRLAERVTATLGDGRATDGPAVPLLRAPSPAADHGGPARAAQTGPADPASGAAAGSAAVLLAAEAGAPLPSGLRRQLEPAFGADFGSVRIHTSDRAAAAAEQVGARAFTLGTHVAFARGEDRFSTPSGLQLLVHELAHVVQQGRSHTEPTARGRPPTGSAAGPESPQRSGVMLLRQVPRRPGVLGGGGPTPAFGGEFSHKFEVPERTFRRKQVRLWVSGEVELKGMVSSGDGGRGGAETSVKTGTSGGATVEHEAGGSTVEMGQTVTGNYKAKLQQEITERTRVSGEVEAGKPARLAITFAKIPFVLEEFTIGGQFSFRKPVVFEALMRQEYPDDEGDALELGDLTFVGRLDVKLKVQVGVSKVVAAAARAKARGAAANAAVWIRAAYAAGRPLVVKAATAAGGVLFVGGAVLAPVGAAGMLVAVTRGVAQDRVRIAFAHGASRTLETLTHGVADEAEIHRLEALDMVNWEAALWDTAGRFEQAYIDRDRAGQSRYLREAFRAGEAAVVQMVEDYLDLYGHEAWLDCEVPRHERRYGTRGRAARYFAEMTAGRTIHGYPDIDVLLEQVPLRPPSRSSCHLARPGQAREADVHPR